jgi:hypothetical protein
VRLALVLLAACAGASARPPAPQPGPEALGGYWELADSSHVVMQVTLLGDHATIEAWATDTGERFDVAAVDWDGRRLRATFTYPPTHTTTTSELVLVNSDRLEGGVTGAYTGQETWLRIAPSDVTPPKSLPATPTGSSAGFPQVTSPAPAGTPRTPP